MINIIFLYSELGPYLMNLFKGITESDQNIKIHVIHWDKQINTPYVPEIIPNVFYYKKSFFSTKTSLHNFISKQTPKIIYVSGWMDNWYLYVVYKLKKNTSVKIIAGIDDLWHGTIKQKVASFIAPLFFKKFFDYFWVAGLPQYFYARKMGYNDSQIILHLLTTNSNVDLRINKIKKRFLYVGRYHKNKGLINLLKTYSSLPVEIKKEWPLELYGNGPLLNDMKLYENNFITINGYLSQELLKQEYFKGGVFVLPSYFEAWGVVVHEAVSYGLPIILSNKVGSNLDFLINRYNGFIFSNTTDLYSIFTYVSKLSDVSLNKMATNSYKLSKRITTEMSVASFISKLD